MKKYNNITIKSLVFMSQGFEEDSKKYVVEFISEDQKLLQIYVLKYYNKVMKNFISYILYNDKNRIKKVFEKDGDELYFYYEFSIDENMKIKDWYELFKMIFKTKKFAKKFGDLK